MTFLYDLAYLSTLIIHCWKQGHSNSPPPYKKPQSHWCQHKLQSTSAFDQQKQNTVPLFTISSFETDHLVRRFAGQLMNPLVYFSMPSQ